MTVTPERVRGSRRQLVAIAGAAALPIVLFAAIMAVLFGREQRSAVEQLLRQTATLAINVADRELAADLGVLRALAHMAQTPGAGRVVFPVQAARVLGARPDWLGLAVEDLGRPRRNALLLASRPHFVPPLIDDETARRLRSQDQPVIGSLGSNDPHGSVAYIRIAIGVVDGNSLALSAFVDPSSFSRALAREPIPQDWTAAILDGAHRILARNRNPESFVGTAATESLRRQIEAGGDRYFFALNKEGKRVYTATSHSPLSGWSSAVGVPASVVEAPLRRTIAAIAGGGALAVLLAALAGTLVSRNYLARQSAERRLLASEAGREAAQQLTDVAANFPGAIIRRVLHPDGSVSYPFVSDGISDVMGIPADAARRGTSLRDLAANVHPDDWPAWQEQVLRSAREMRPYRIDARVVTGAGVRWVRSIGRPHRAAGGDIVWDGVLLDVTDVKRAEEHQTLLLRELSHRVKNTLAVVNAIASRTIDSSTSMAEFREAFQGRLQALSRVHSLLTESRWEGARLAAVVERSVTPHRRDASDLVCSGPDVDLDTRAALTLTLVLHELATNAAKYGALSTPGGTVAIRWSLRESGRRAVHLVWSEQGGPPVAQPSRSGFGTTLIARSVVYELSGEVRLDYPPGGFRCEISFPLDAPV